MALTHEQQEALDKANQRAFNIVSAPAGDGAFPMHPNDVASINAGGLEQLRIAYPDLSETEIQTKWNGLIGNAARERSYRDNNPI